ncbi:hypothetical protein KEM56_002510 [Ascosphaera pollenicola]|nr:hypothetical protein KEM56_002510 [Ascosphaera pollenicola]
MAAKAPLIVPALTKHTASVIMLHGLGDRIMLAENWRRRHQFDEVSFIFPNAPRIPITVNMGMKMPGWYNVRLLSAQMTFEEFQRVEDEPGVVASRDYVNTLIAEEVSKGIPLSRIVLGGFSQGGALSIFTGLTYKEKLGGIFVLSAYVPFANRIRSFLQGHEEGSWANKSVPVFQGHGTLDPIIPIAIGERSSEILKELGMDVEFKKYRGLDHSVDPDEIEDLSSFLKRIIPDQEEKLGGGGDVRQEGLPTMQTLTSPLSQGRALLGNPERLALTTSLDQARLRRDHTKAHYVPSIISCLTVSFAQIKQQDVFNVRALDLLKRASALAQDSSSGMTFNQVEPTSEASSKEVPVPGNEFELEITTKPPTEDQLNNIFDYLGSTAALPGKVSDIVQGARDKEDAIRKVMADGNKFIRPVVSCKSRIIIMIYMQAKTNPRQVVDWSNGKAVLGGSEPLIIKMLKELPQ